MCGILFLIVLGLPTLFWLCINLSPARRRNLDFRLDVSDLPADGQVNADPLPGVAIICPGRNEADMIGTTLPELCQQDYPRESVTDDSGSDTSPSNQQSIPSGGYRVVYIDDHSEDATPSITAACRARFDHLLVVRNEQDPPAGWVGKCWAVRQGYAALLEAEARSNKPPAQWVCFTDADIHWNPNCLQRAMRHAQEQNADVVALFPRLTFGTAAEALAQTTMVIGLGVFFPFEKAMDPNYSGTITGGAFMLVRRSLYDSIGGHEAVAGCVIEDINLGRKLKAAGGRIRLAVTVSLMHCRMYEGWADMWEGLTKNAYAGLEYNPFFLIAFVICACFGAITTPIYPIISAVWLFHGGGTRAWVALALSLLLLLLQAVPMHVVRKLLALPWWYSLAAPAGSAIYTVFMTVSAWRYYRGGNTWKGRTYGPATVKAQAAR